MSKLIEHSAYNARLVIPSSKSYMQRAVALAILAQGQTVLYNPDFSNDSLAVLEIARRLGCSVQINSEQVAIKTFKSIKNPNLSVGEAGLAIRLFTPVCGLFGKEITIGGYGSLLKRPIDAMIEPLKNLGEHITTANGFVPITISGKLEGGVTDVDGSLSSQFLTGLLIALPTADKDSVLNVINLKSVPYVDMTLSIMKKFGIEIQNRNYKTFIIEGRRKYKGCEYTVEGDWSSAAVHLVAGAVAGRSEIFGLNPGSLQADKELLNVLMACGAKISVDYKSVVVEKCDLFAFEFDATDCPDLFPVMAALAASCNGTSRIKGISRLAHKESDRATAVKTEFSKLGIDVKLEDDYMFITGGKIIGGKVSSYHDHRMAMALAVCGLTAEGPVQIDDTECVSKSYPKFWDHFLLSLVNDRF